MQNTHFDTALKFKGDLSINGQSLTKSQSEDPSYRLIKFEKHYYLDEVLRGGRTCLGELLSGSVIKATRLDNGASESLLLQLLPDGRWVPSNKKECFLISQKARNVKAA